MKQIPPRGTPEFEEYKKAVEDAYRNGAGIEIARAGLNDWKACIGPNFDSWETHDYRIGSDQPKSYQNQSPEPAMTAEQRIVKALDQMMYALGEAAVMARFGWDIEKQRRYHDYTDKASTLVTALVSDLPLSSPSPATSEATAPQVDAGNALSSQVGGSHYKDSAIQPVEFITANGLSFLEGCVVKRICRHRKKNGVEDLRKAIHEIQLLIELEYGKEQP